MSKQFWRFLVAYIIKIDELEDRVKELEKDQLRMADDVGELQTHLVQILEDK